MKDGKMISGKVVGQNATNIELKTATGSMWLAKNKISHIKYKPMTDAEKLAKKEAARKRLEAQKAARLKIEKDAREKLQKEKLIKELEEKEREEALVIAQEKARRAEALRELVANQTMEKPVDEPISYKDFAWRSMVLPGWGHFYLEKPVMGTIYSGTGAFLLVNAYVKYKDAVVAKKKNHDEVLQNMILFSIPSVAPQAVRAALSIEANRRKWNEYQTTVDQSEYSLALLGIFYGAQLIHIIYNGIAWENGLPVVENSDSQRVKFSGFISPEMNSGNKRGVSGFASMTFSF